MDYNLADKQKEVISWMVEANWKGELDDEFSVAWYTGGANVFGGRSGVELFTEPPEITRGILDALESSGHILCEIKNIRLRSVSQEPPRGRASPKDSQKRAGGVR